MKIGIDGRALRAKKTGIGVYTYEIIKELNNIDNENEYIIYSNREIVLDFKLNKNFKTSITNNKIGTLWLYFCLPKKIFKDKIEIFWGTQHCLPKRNKYTKNIKYLLTIHDIALQKIKHIGSLYNTIVQKLILNVSCKNADKIITVSNSTKNDLIDILKINENKIDVVYVCNSNISLDNLALIDIKNIQNKYNIHNDTPFIFFLSTIEPRKNLDTAIKAFNLYKKRFNDNLKFIVSGGLGWKYNKTLKLINKSIYKKDIILTGYISEKEKAYFMKNCKAFVFPTLYEGFGLPILEAMHYHALIISSNNSSIPEVGGDAILYLNNVYDYNELLNLIESAINMTQDEKRKIIEKEDKQILKFSWKKTALEIFKSFQKFK